ncbi:hypothetical protein IFM89_012071, partial [Coptis chinensis]
MGFRSLKSEGANLGSSKSLMDIKNPGFRAWLAKQSLPVEATVVTATSAVQGATIGGFMGTLTSDVTSAFPTPPPEAALNPQVMASLQQAQ